MSGRGTLAPIVAEQDPRNAVRCDRCGQPATKRLVPALLKVRFLCDRHGRHIPGEPLR